MARRVVPADATRHTLTRRHLQKHFAARVEKLAPDTRGRLTEAYRLALGRNPSADELKELTAYANRHGLANACRVLLNSNEFLFVN